MEVNELPSDSPALEMRSQEDMEDKEDKEGTEDREGREDRDQERVLSPP